MNKITFFSRLERQILSGKKTATIRDKSESDYVVGQVVEAFTFEDNREIGKLEITGIEPIQLSQLNRQHAKAENLPFVFLLKWLLRRIYRQESQLYFISFRVID